MSIDMSMAVGRHVYTMPLYTTLHHFTPLYTNIHHSILLLYYCTPHNITIHYQSIPHYLILLSDAVVLLYGITPSIRVMYFTLQGEEE